MDGVLRTPLTGLSVGEASRRLTEDGLNGLRVLSVLAAVRSLYLWAVLTGRPDDEARSITVAPLAVGNLALILVNRSWCPR